MLTHTIVVEYPHCLSLALQIKDLFLGPRVAECVDMSICAPAVSAVACVFIAALLGWLCGCPSGVIALALLL